MIRHSSTEEIHIWNNKIIPYESMVCRAQRAKNLGTIRFHSSLERKTKSFAPVRFTTMATTLATSRLGSVPRPSQMPREKTPKSTAKVNPESMANRVNSKGIRAEKNFEFSMDGSRIGSQANLFCLERYVSFFPLGE